MNWTFANLIQLAWETVRNPREGASTVLNFAPHVAQSGTFWCSWLS